MSWPGESPGQGVWSGRGRGVHPQHLLGPARETRHPLGKAHAQSLEPLLGRGRGRGSGGWLHGSSTRMDQMPTPEAPLGTLLYSLKNSDFHDDAKRYVTESIITECREVASYNWLDRGEPTMVVPGLSRKAATARTRLTKSQVNQRNGHLYPRHASSSQIAASMFATQTPRVIPSILSNPRSQLCWP